MVPQFLDIGEHLSIFLALQGNGPAVADAGNIGSCLSHPRTMPVATGSVTEENTTGWFW